MKISEIVDILDADLLTDVSSMDNEIEKCGSSDLMSDILAGQSEKSLLITGLLTIQAIRTAIIAGIGGVVFVRGKEPAKEIIEMANDADIPLLRTRYSMFVTSGRLHNAGMTGLDGQR
ncbi:MAG: hypothetical protein GY714_26460 [Desulfobacterales bacterium]|nr:hypothetical protein [Desulfobacterales bacterium]MCP4164240.1 hypothetical protein [Deltaproteobacteria bacterium]